MTTRQFLFPINLELRDRPVLVVGAGRVAVGKIAKLLHAGAAVTVVAPEAVAEIATSRDLRWFQRTYQRGEVASYRLAITATDDAAVNTQVAADGERANVFVNSADDPANCSFTLPALARSGDVQVAVSTNGRSPALASSLARSLREQLVGYGELLEVVAQVRSEAIASFGTSEVQGWRSALDHDLVALVHQGRNDEVIRTIRSHLGLRDQVDVAVSS